MNIVKAPLDLGEAPGQDVLHVVNNGRRPRIKRQVETISQLMTYGPISVGDTKVGSVSL